MRSGHGTLGETTVMTASAGRESAGAPDPATAQTGRDPDQGIVHSESDRGLVTWVNEALLGQETGPTGRAHAPETTYGQDQPHLPVEEMQTVDSDRLQEEGSAVILYPSSVNSL